MSVLRIQGGRELVGEVEVKGSKTGSTTMLATRVERK